MVRRQTEVSKEHLRAVPVDEDVFGLQVTVGNARVVACLHRVDDRQKRGPDELVVVCVDAVIELVEEVSGGAEFEDEVEVLVVVPGVVERDDLGVVCDGAVECDLAMHHRELAGGSAGLADDLHRTVDFLLGRGVEGLVDDAKSAGAQHPDEGVVADDDVGKVGEGG